MQIGVVLTLIAVASFAAWPFWMWMFQEKANAALMARTKALVDKNPELKPAWDQALKDEVLTRNEAKSIIESAGETLGPDE
jgi:hypothetical protein